MSFRTWLLQSPPAEWLLWQARELVIQALRQGPVPQHVAFVMDGNRRYARTHQMEVVEGHNLGFEALAKILEVCYKTGVKVVTIYAFSVENFKRPKHEVDALMDMAKTKLIQIAQHGELLDRYGAAIRILGQRDLIKDDVRNAMDEAINMTKHNTRAVLNVCFPYTSREEISTAIRSVVDVYSRPLKYSNAQRPFSESRITANIRSHRLSKIAEEDRPPSKSLHAPDAADAPWNHDSSSPSDDSTSTLHLDSSSNSSQPHSPDLSAQIGGFSNYPDPEKITPQTLTDFMYTAGTPPLDLLVRTSGVERLSDFMLWQCHERTSIVFLKCFWPEFDLWHFLPVFVEWQWWRRKADEARAGEGRTSRLKLA